MNNLCIVLLTSCRKTGDAEVPPCYEQKCNPHIHRFVDRQDWLRNWFSVGFQQINRPYEY